MATAHLNGQLQSSWELLGSFRLSKALSADLGTPGRPLGTAPGW